MIFIDRSSKEYTKKFLKELRLDNIEFLILNFNIKQDEFKLFSDSIFITDNNIKMYRGNLLIAVLDISELNITKLSSLIPLDKKVNTLTLNEVKNEYIISFKQYNCNTKQHRLNHIYIIERQPIDYIYTKK